MSGETDDNAPGRTLAKEQLAFERFRLVRSIDRGGFGPLWQALELESGETVMLRFVPEALARDEDALSRLRDDVNRARDVDHPHVVRVREFLEDEYGAAICSDAVTGETLGSLRYKRPGHVFSPQSLSPWLAQLCDGLRLAEEYAGLVHGEVNPVTLLIDSGGQLRIAELGVARHFADFYGLAPAGQPNQDLAAFRSPQRIAGEEPKPTDDVYAVGATMYDMLTGKPPFYMGDLLDQIERQIPPPLHDRRRVLGHSGEAIPILWERSVAACLEKDPERRPRNARETSLSFHLPDRDAAAASEPVRPQRAEVAAAAAAVSAKGSVKGQGHGSEMRRSNRRRRRRATLVWLGLITAALGVGYVAWWQKRASEVAESAEERRRAAEPGHVLVKTAPEGALVRIGEETQRAPTAFMNMAVGEHEGLATLEGFDDLRFKVTVEPGKTRDLGTLRLARTAGSLRVETEPAGMPFRLENEPGQTGHEPIRFDGVTPMLLTNLPTGKFVVFIERDGWPAYSRQVTVKKNKEAEVRWRFDQSWVNIDSIPRGVEILIEGRHLGRTPLRRQLPTGPHEVGGRYFGYPEQKRVFQVTANHEAEVFFDLSPGQITLTSQPSGAIVRLGTNELGRTPLIEHAIPRGTWQFTAQFDDWPDEVKVETEVREGETARAFFAFQSGAAEVVSEPVGATVFSMVRGERELGVTPLRVSPVRPGPVRFRVWKPGFKSQTVTAFVDTNQIERIEVKLERENPILDVQRFEEVRDSVQKIRPEQAFEQFYVAMHEAEKLEKSGADSREMAELFQKCYALVTGIEKFYPQWQPTLIRVRKKELNEKLSIIQEQIRQIYGESE